MLWWGSPTQLTFLILHFITSKELVQAHFANALPRYQNQNHRPAAGSFVYKSNSSSENLNILCAQSPLMCQSDSYSQIPFQQHRPVLPNAQPTLTSYQIFPQHQSYFPFPISYNNDGSGSNNNQMYYKKHINSLNPQYWPKNNIKRGEEGHEVKEEVHGETEMKGWGWGELGEVKANHGEMEMKGWGWGEVKAKQKHIPHKKKGKKGALAKILNKFRPKSKKRQPLVWKEERECDGWENFLKDLEIISWILGIIGFIKASVAFLLHILNQSYGFVSIVKIGLPERLSTFVDLIAPGTTPEVLQTILAVIGLVDYLITLFASYPLGNLIVFIDGIAEALTIPSLALATFTIFDDLVEEKVWSIFGIDVRDLFDGYGCPSSNPFSKEKKIEHFFKEHSSILSGEGESKGKGWGWGHGMEKRRQQSANSFVQVRTTE